MFVARSTGSLCDRVCRYNALYGNALGVFDMNLFTNGLGPVLGNSQCAQKRETLFRHILPVCCPIHAQRHVVYIHRKADPAQMFSRLRAGTYRPAALTDAGDESGPGRVSIQECPYDFMILYRNEGTPIGMDDCVAARLRFAHYGSQHISKLVTSGVNTGLQLSQSTLVGPAARCATAVLAA